MTEKDFVPGPFPKKLSKGQATWTAPSNIALVKYWGKGPDQVPANASVSLTLDVCTTTTTVYYTPLKKRAPDFSFDILLDGKINIGFKPKIHTFLRRIDPYLPFLKDVHIRIETTNTFPHSSGIASSASGMAALALCLLEMEKVANPDADEEYCNKKASFLARLGSGSACRSIQGKVVHWGRHPNVEGSSDLYGIPYPYKIHPVFENYEDTILIVHRGQKQVSSTAGHDLMHNHPFASRRFEQANENVAQLQDILATGDLDRFIQMVEHEALTLHAMMMTSVPYFILMEANTLKIIKRIWAFRKRTGTHVCFTLDAGANVHLLYPQNERKEVVQFIYDELVILCGEGQLIRDRIGSGALAR
ncbi:MAG TPA: hypothetical protein VKN36_05255 [Eudoraea sp.]|nr:hypothetical protein [Eudoraea sp.]